MTTIGSEYSLEGPETAPGYYEFMVLKEGKDYAELNVNGYSGQVWFETWHGPIVSTVETKKKVSQNDRGSKMLKPKRSTFSINHVI